MIIHKDFPLSEITYYKIGGTARFLLEIENEKDVTSAFEFIKTNKIKHIICLGLGANILINDNIFDGAVLWFCKAEFGSIELEKDGLVKVFAGVVLDNLIQFTFDNNLIGLEWAGGLPSTVGGAVRGNVGAFGGEIKNSVESVEFFELSQGTFEKRRVSVNECTFSYRKSIFKNNKNVIITNVLFKFTPVQAHEVKKARVEYFSHIEYRNTHHPMSYPSCGSVFKNIRDKEEIEKILSKWPDIQDLVTQKWHGKISMGYIIKKLGFSGFQIGGAQVSEDHANYIINKNNASFNDVVAVIEKIKDGFFKEFGFYPEAEVEIVT